MLTDTEIRAAKAAIKPIKLFDEKGLYRLVKPGGARLWRFKYRFPPKAAENTEKLLALGPYPDVSLKQAREKRDKARSDLANSIDPGLKRAAERHGTTNTFKAVALELLPCSAKQRAVVMDQCLIFLSLRCREVESLASESRFSKIPSIRWSAGLSFTFFRISERATLQSSPEPSSSAPSVASKSKANSI